MSSPVARLMHRALTPFLRGRNRLLHAGRVLAHRLGVRQRTSGDERLSVIVLSYARPQNIDLILSAVVACDFVSEIIVSNNNPDVALEYFIHVHDPRIRLVHQPRRTPPSVRFELSQEAVEPWILAIDDDVFPSARQVRMLFERLLAAPHAVHGYGGEVWGDPPAKATYRCVRRPRGTVAVDTLIWAFAYTRDHVATYFELLDKLGIVNAQLLSSEDVPLSFAGCGPALIHGVGPLCRCPSDSDPAVATWLRPGFFGQRRELVARCRALLDTFSEGAVSASANAGHPRVSVIVPTRGRPAQLHACLEALHSQTMPPGSFEVIVVDDGSRPAVKLDRRRWSRACEIRLIHQVCSGPAAARARGVAEARGSVVAFTDDDCLPAAAWLTDLTRALDARPDVMVGGSTVNGIPEDFFADMSQFILELAYDHFNADGENAGFFASNNLACGRRLYAEAGGFDPDYRAPAAEDRDFCDRWRRRGLRLVWVRAAEVVHHHHQGFAGFTRLHFRYGRGAWEYHRRRRRRASGTMAWDIQFHRSLPARLPAALRRRYPPWRWPLVLSVLVWWQLVNAAGFTWEAVRLSLLSVGGPAPGRSA